MGMNYYWQPGEDDPLRPFRKVHIGKQSYGWQFTFQGYRFAGSPEQELEIASGLSIVLDTSALNIQATSWQEWRELLERGGTIVDEDDQVVSLETFIELVEQHSAPGKRTEDGRLLLNHVECLRRHPSFWSSERTFDEACDWIDAQGYAFSMGQFT